MKITYILGQSLYMVRAEPKLFVPRLFTTAAYTLFLLKVVQVFLGLGGKGINGSLLALLPPFALLLSMDTLVYGMYASLSRDYSRGREISLLGALKDALSQLKSLLLLAIAGGAFLALAIAMAAVPAFAAITSDNPYLLILSAMAALAALLLFAIIFFFAIPSAVLEKKGSHKALSLSLNLGMKNRKEVISLNAFFALLILVTMGIASATGMEGGIFLLSLGFFFAGRFVQAIVYTYISVVIPTAFLMAGSEDG